MPVPASINDLSPTAGNNSPAGSESPTTTDDYLRSLAAFIAVLRDRNADAQSTADSKANKAGDTFTGDVIVPSLNGGQLAGLRNLLINGNFAVNQRGFMSGTVAASANHYALDRWRIVTSGQSVTFTASGNGNQVTAPAGGLEQVIEGANIGGGTYVLSWAGTATATVNGAARANGDSFTLPAGTNATVRFISGTVSKAQLEPGTKATPFEHRPYGLEISLCQRYWQLVRISLFGFAASAGVSIACSVPFFQQVRATPTLVARTITESVGVSGASFTQVSVSGAKYAIAASANQVFGATVDVAIDAEL